MRDAKVHRLPKACGSHIQRGGASKPELFSTNIVAAPQLMH